MRSPTQTTGLDPRAGEPVEKGRPERRPIRGRPRVALVAHDIHEGGGMERALAELIRLASTRVDFVVIASTLDEPLRPLVRWHRVPVPRRPFVLKFLSFYVIAGLRLVRTRADLVHTMGAIVPNRVSLATVQVCQAAWAAATGGLAPKEAPWLRRVNTSVARLFAIAVERRTYRPGRLRVLAAVSEAGRDALREHYPDVRVVITPNGVDLGRFRPDAATRDALRSSEAVAPDEVVALFVGGDWDRKGLGIAIEALTLARQRGAAPLRLWVVGDGDEQRFRHLAARHGVADSVRFFGHRRDPQRFYQAADVFVLPTQYETFPLVALEAAATGLPIVMTRVGGTVEIGPEAGFLVEPTPAAVGQALSSLASDAALRKRMGSAGRRRTREYSWRDSVESVLQLYGELLDVPMSSGSR